MTKKLFACCICLLLVVGGVSVGYYRYSENEKAAQAVLVAEQQAAAEIALAEKAAAEKAATEKAEAEKAAAEKAAAEKAAAEKAATEKAEAEKAAAEKEAAELAASSQAASATSSNAAAQPSMTEGSKKNSAANGGTQTETDAPIPDKGSSSTAPIKGTPPPGNSKSDAAGLPTANGDWARMTDEEKAAFKEQSDKEEIAYRGKQWVGKDEPAKSETVESKMWGFEWSWDSSVGGWRCTKYTGDIIFPSGDRVLNTG